MINIVETILISIAGAILFILAVCALAFMVSLPFLIVYPIHICADWVIKNYTEITDWGYWVTFCGFYTFLTLVGIVENLLKWGK